MLTNHFAEQAACVDGFEPTIEPHRGSYVAVAEEPPNRFVISRMVLQVDGSGRVPELVDGDSQTSCLLDPLGELNPEQMGILGPASRPWEQPISIRSAHRPAQRRGHRQPHLGGAL